LFPEIDVSFSGTIATRDSQTTCDRKCKTRSGKTQKSSSASAFCPCDLDAGGTKLASFPTRSNGRPSIAELQHAATRVGTQTTCRLRPKLGIFEKTSRICEGDKLVDDGGSHRIRRVGGGDKAGAEARAAKSEFWNLAHEIPEARIRAFLELAIGGIACFFRPAAKGGVTSERSARTWWTERRGG
jgi:hypothetical protein